METIFPTLQLLSTQGDSATRFFEKYSTDAVHSHLNALTESAHWAPQINEASKANVLGFIGELRILLENVRLQSYPFDSLCAITPSFCEETLVSLEGVIDFIKQAIPVGMIYNISKTKQELDLMVVLEKNCVKPYTDYEHLIDLALLGYQQGNCTIHNYGLLNAQLLNGHLFYSSVCIEENVVYRKNTAEIFGHASEEIIECVRFHSANVFSAGMAKAKQFYQGVQHYFKEGIYELAAFMLHQACELTYRCLLNVLRGKDLKCHSPIILRKHVRRFAPEIIGVFSAIEEKEIAYLQILEDAYIKARYHIDYTIDKETLSILNHAVGKLQEVAKLVFDRVVGNSLELNNELY